MRRHNAHERWTVPRAAAYAALCRSGVHDLRVVTRSYSLSQLSLLKTHETLVPSVGRFQSADRLTTNSFRHGKVKWEVHSLTAPTVGSSSPESTSGPSDNPLGANPEFGIQRCEFAYVNAMNRQRNNGI